jgi:DNA-binding transcriptional MerR regulator
MSDSLPEAPIYAGNDEPLYNIGVVTRMTGISMATLRAWERRYNFPDSSRTSGGHRLYTENDVRRLRWVRDRIDEGMGTARAVHALHHMEAQGQLIQTESSAAVKEPAREGLSGLEKLQQQLTRYLLEKNLEKADQTLGEALATFSPEDLILHMIAPCMNDIGEAWEENDTSVATEHFATNFLRQRLLMWMVNGPPPQSRPPIVLACAPGEWHEGSLLILGALLRRRRWPVAYLGQSVPLSDLATFVKDIRPQMVIDVAMLESTAAQLAEWPQWLPQVAQSGKPVFGYGGRIYTQNPEWRLRTAGIFLGETLVEGLHTVESLVK